MLSGDPAENKLPLNYYQSQNEYEKDTSLAVVIFPFNRCVISAYPLRMRIRSFITLLVGPLIINFPMNIFPLPLNDR
jgi:hypothetical protein